MLFFGLWAFGGSAGTAGAGNPLQEQFADGPLETLLRAIVLPALETLFWQALFFDASARLRLSRWIPLLLSPLLFALALHWQRGPSAMAEAFWYWLVLGLVYASQRPRSFKRAFALTTAVHWTPLAFLLVAPVMPREAVAHTSLSLPNISLQPMVLSPLRAAKPTAELHRYAA